MDLWLGKVIRIQVHYNIGCPDLEVWDDVLKWIAFALCYCFVLPQNRIYRQEAREVSSLIPEIFPPSITRAHQGPWRDRDLKGMTGKAVVQGQLCQDVQLLLRFVMKGTLYPVRLPPFRKSRNARPHLVKHSNFYYVA